MQTLIKWPGGKSQEFEYIKDMIPEYDRYIEPFFGGGAVFFQLTPKKAIINDICEELTDFYKLIKDQENKDEFKKELLDYANNWEKIPGYLKVFEKKLYFLYDKYKKGEIELVELKKTINDSLKKDEDRFNGLFHKNFCLDEKNLLEQIISNIISKLRRTKIIEQQRGKLPEGDLHKNIETAFRSGFYMHFRDIMNLSGTKYKISKAKKIANYYFIREFCYASMFRFNNSGHFNIPYGGIAYNNKDFRKKVNYILSEDVKKVFNNTVIKNVDFEKMFNEFKYTTRDFFFLDPPYDTDFSDYEKASFDKKDQERLAKCLYKTKAKFILIIKNTPFIYSLYNKKKGIKIKKFDKTYLYNVKGRNDREVEHLIIYNF